jgi:hypothetical protein
MKSQSRINCGFPLRRLLQYRHERSEAKSDWMGLAAQKTVADVQRRREDLASGGRLWRLDRRGGYRLKLVDLSSMTAAAKRPWFHFNRKWLFVAIAGLGCGAAIMFWLTAAPQGEVDRLSAAFQNYSGVKLVFERGELPPGDYHERMMPLSPAGREDAARIAQREVYKYPRRYLGSLGLSTVGIFESCISTRADGFRDYDEELQGYRYYGIYNGSSAIAAAYYTDRQLPLTLHHEIFHHVERVAGEITRGWPDDRWTAALSGKDPYPALKLTPDDLAALERISTGEILDDSVSSYAARNPREDRAETARYLLSYLPDALLQAARRPDLPGSQRILHVLETYRRAASGHGPDANWFVDVALGRTKN